MCPAPIGSVIVPDLEAKKIVLELLTYWMDHYISICKNLYNKIFTTKISNVWTFNYKARTLKSEGVDMHKIDLKI